MFDRRLFLKMPVVGALLGRGTPMMAASRRDFFKELGVKPFINAAGTYTTLTASLMRPEVMEAMQYASKQFVQLNDMHDAAGKRIAELTGADAAMVTSGASGALTCATAACLAGSNVDLIKKLPDTTGMKNEVIIQKSHRYGYDHAVKNCGTKFIEVETREDVEKAAGAQTAMMLFFNANDNVGKIKAQEFVELGKKFNVPTLNDAAADVPPVENITKYNKMGFDLVTFSGGKGIRGPQSAGVLMGRKDLIAAARRNTSPFSDGLGRGMKVNKEEMLGMMVAVETFLKLDHAAEWKEYEKRVKQIADSVHSVKSIKTETYVPEIANHVPHLRISWDEAAVGVTVREAVERLRSGEPSIEVVPGSRESLGVAVWMLQAGEAEIVAKRIREVLKRS